MSIHDPRRVYCSPPCFAAVDPNVVLSIKRHLFRHESMLVKIQSNKPWVSSSERPHARRQRQGHHNPDGAYADPMPMISVRALGTT